MSTKPGVVVAVMAEFETRHFTFRAFGATEDEARKLLARAWAVHAKNTGADPGYLKENEDGVNCTEVKLGVVLCDGSEVELGETLSERDRVQRHADLRQRMADRNFENKSRGLS